MSTPTDRDYYSQRAAQERRLAESAGHPSARETHLELARRYDERAAAANAAPLALGGAAQGQQELS